jgi:hypothetical protein
MVLGEGQEQHVALLPVVADVLINPSAQVAGQGVSTQEDDHWQEDVHICVPPLPQACV